MWETEVTKTVAVPSGIEQGAFSHPPLPGPRAVHDRPGTVGRGAAARAATTRASDAEAVGHGVQQDPPGAAGDGAAVSETSLDTPSLPALALFLLPALRSAHHVPDHFILS